MKEGWPVFWMQTAQSPYLFTELACFWAVAFHEPSLINTVVPFSSKHLTPPSFIDTIYGQEQYGSFDG